MLETSSIIKDTDKDLTKEGGPDSESPIQNLEVSQTFNDQREFNGNCSKRVRFTSIILFIFAIIVITAFWILQQKNNSKQGQRLAVTTPVPKIQKDTNETKQITDNKTNTIKLPSETSTTQNKKRTETFPSISTEKTFTAGDKYIPKGNRYSISVLPGWEIKHEWSEQLYSEDLYIIHNKSNMYKLRISKGARSGAVCTYSDIQEEGNDPYLYHSYIDLKDLDGNSYRREDYFKNTGLEQVGNDNLLCQYVVTDNIYSTFTLYGNIWYIFPLDEFGRPIKDLDRNLINQMDAMVRSLKAVN